MRKKAPVSPLGCDHAAMGAARARHARYRATHLRFAVAEKVARLLIGFRQQHDLTQAQLAKNLGMKESAVSRLESGEHVPNFATLERIAQGCNVEVVLDFAARESDAPPRKTQKIVA